VVLSFTLLHRALCVQVTTLAVRVHGHGVPCAYFVSVKRDQATYVRFLQSLVRASGGDWCPNAVVTDFEHALQHAVAEVFPDAGLWGCYFHYSQVSVPGC